MSLVCQATRQDLIEEKVPKGVLGDSGKGITMDFPAIQGNFEIRKIREAKPVVLFINTVRQSHRCINIPMVFPSCSKKRRFIFFIEEKRTAVIIC